MTEVRRRVGECLDEEQSLTCSTHIHWSLAPMKKRVRVSDSNELPEVEVDKTRISLS